MRHRLSSIRPIFVLLSAAAVFSVATSATAGKQVERRAAVTRAGKPLTLLGPEVKEGQPAPDFEVVDANLEKKRLADYKGSVLLVLSVPSLDTPVCDAEARRFNEEATKLGSGVRVLVISMDLPFAQKRFCSAAGIDRVVALSDHTLGAFGSAYGTLIKELRLLSRAVFVIDPHEKIAYAEYVKEMKDHPQYDRAIEAVRRVLQ